MPTDVTREEMNARLAAVQAEFRGDINVLRGDMNTGFAEIRREMHEGFAGMVKWIVGVAIAGAAVIVSVLTFYVNTAQRPSAPAPIVINIPMPATAASK